MSSPRVSICLPNLNNRAFLGERLDTIYAQTFADWELIVSDNLSEDGAWEFFQEQAQRERRMHIAQAPRTGMYANWNRCVERARGEFVYIATSDDTIPPDCIEKLVAALDSHPECGLAHCSLRVIDESGNEPEEDWWEDSSMFGISSGGLLHKMHVRKAPLDGLLHLTGKSVYISITQLLIRRSVFERIGLFEPRWGSVGDFAWNMLAGLVVDAVHVPATWGGWRIHAGQATAAAGIGEVDHLRKIDEMIADSLRKSENHDSGRVLNELRSEWETESREIRHFYSKLRNTGSFVTRQAFVARSLVDGSRAARRHLWSRLRGEQRNFEAVLADEIRRSVERVVGGPVLVAEG